MEELDKLRFGWTWDDDGLLGRFHVDCLCGRRQEVDVFSIGNDRLKCECGRYFIVKRTTTVLFKNSNKQ